MTRHSNDWSASVPLATLKAFVRQPGRVALQSIFMSDLQLERVRKICYALPEVTEKLSHGEPTFFVKKKVFVMYSDHHHCDEHLAVMIPAPLGFQEMMIKAAPEKFYRPPYVGVKGWIGIELRNV